MNKVQCVGCITMSCTTLKRNIRNHINYLFILINKAKNSVHRKRGTRDLYHPKRIQAREQKEYKETKRRKINTREKEETKQKKNRN